MNKVLALVILTIAPALASAQGTIAVGNGTGLVKQWNLGGGADIPVPKNGGYVQVIAAPKGTPILNPLFTPTPGDNWPTLQFPSLSGFLAANPGWDVASVLNSLTPAPPTLIGLGDGLFNGLSQTVNNISRGAQADYFLIGWTGSFATFEDAVEAARAANCMLGASAITTTSTGDPTATPPDNPVLLRSTFPGMTLTLVYVVPEPNAVAIVGLGAGILMVFRRRR